MTISGNFFELREQSDGFSSELDCGWNGFPQNGGLNVKFYDKDEDGFAWTLELDFQPENGTALSTGGTCEMKGISLKLDNDGTEIAHTINTEVEKNPTFAHVAAIVLQARKLKPVVTEEEKAAKAAAKAEAEFKKQIQGMGLKIQ